MNLLPLALALLLIGYVFLPAVQANVRLTWTFAGVGSALVAWQLIVLMLARTGRLGLGVEFVPVKSHWVQACVQFGILAYWGWYAPMVYAEAPLILAQVLFLYAFEGLVTWSRGRVWRLGFGPLPIIFSTNLLLWFKDDWFVFQFLMIALGALGKQFVTWTRDGRRGHIFNPSAFGQFLVAVVLISTGTTNDLTWGREIATTFETPHMLLVIFLGGLIVQYLFHVTLMTLAAVSALCLLNLVYTGMYDTYFFVNINIAAPIFLGVHLLVTDPSTSPRTNLGRIGFGALYGLAYGALFRILDLMEVPLFWDKLLPVPILNLCVPLFDRLARWGPIGALNRAWEGVLSAGRMNLVHMGCWIALFGTMFGTGFIEAPHPGNSIPFWNQALADGKPHAGHSLVMAVGAQAEGGRSAAAFNELGLICIDGRVPAVRTDPAKAAHYFARAAELGSRSGNQNVAIQFLFQRSHISDAVVQRALDRLEKSCDEELDPLACYLIGTAYETGRGRPKDLARAVQCYARFGRGNLYAAKGLARIGLMGEGLPLELLRVAGLLNRASAAGDAESSWYLAYMHYNGAGVPRDEILARQFMERACEQKSADACRILALPQFPPFTKPIMQVPGWQTDFAPPTRPAN